MCSHGRQLLLSQVQFNPLPDRRAGFRDVLAHWNANVATKNFFWMFLKAAVRGSLPGCGEINLGFRSSAGLARLARSRLVDACACLAVTQASAMRFGQSVSGSV